MKKFELRFAVVLLLLIGLVSVSGYLMHHRLTGVVERSRSSSDPDSTVLTLHQISEYTDHAELIVKSFRLTKDTSYRNRYDILKDSLYDFSTHLLRQTQKERFANEAGQIDSLINLRLMVFDSLLYLDDYFRVQAALSKVQDDINEISVQKLKDTVKNDTVKNGFFARVFRSKKKRESIETKRNQSLVNWSEEIDRQVQIIRQEEKRIENALKNAELALLKQDSTLAAEMGDMILGIENKRQAKVAEDSSFAERQIQEVNSIINIYVLLAVCLLLFIAIMIFFYIRRNSKYKKMLQKTSDEAFRLANVRKQFLANMSHEIRTPLNSINGFTNLLGQSKLSEEQQEYVQIIQSSNQHLLAVVNDVLDYSKLEMDKMKIYNKPFDVRQLMKELNGMFEKQAQEKNIQLTFENLLDHPYWSADVYRLKQILINIIGNAIKFTNEGLVNVKFEGQKGLLISVQDSGVGMHPEEIDHVFNAFEQASSNKEANYEGTGLGLAISKKIIDAYNGTVEIKSEKGKGTMIQFYLPVEQATSDELSEMVMDNEIEILKPQKVLIADDEVFNQKLMHSIMEKFNIRHDIVSNGKEALEFLKKDTYDCLLLDVRMPEMDGFEFLRQKNGDYQSLKIYALTAALSDEDYQKLLKLGVDGILYKPFDENDILTIFSKQVQSKKTKKGNMEYNLQPLKDTGGGDVPFIKDMLQTLVDNIESSIEYFEVFIQEENWQALAEQAHKLAGPLRHIEAEQCYTMLKDIENNARAGEELEEIKNTLPNLKIRLLGLSKALSKEIENLK